MRSRSLFSGEVSKSAPTGTRTIERVIYEVTLSYPDLIIAI